MPVIHIEGLSKSFGSNLVFQDINVDIEKGDCISIIGPSGCGKSTFLRCINLLEQPTGGRVFIDGQEITAKGAPLDQIRRKMGMVYQTFNLFSHKTVLENVMMAPMQLQGLSKEDAIHLAMECLTQVGMAERADYMPSQLSGGQKQRAAIARCVAMKPEIILFDEPTSALDPTLVDEVLAVIRRLVNRGMTCVIVTHEMSFAKAVSSQVIYMDEKGIYEMGPPAQIFDSPKRERTRAFINRLKTFQRTITDRNFDIYGLNGAVVEFCRRQFASEKQIYRVQLVLEELLVNIMLPQMKGERIAIDVTVAYSMKDSTLSVYAAADQDFSLEGQGGDDLSLAMLRAVCTDIVREGGGVRLFL